MLKRTLIPALIAVPLLFWAVLYALTPELLPEALGGWAAPPEPGHTATITRPTLPSTDERAALTVSIAERLSALGLGPEAVLSTEPLTLTTPAGPWSVDVMELLLPPHLTPRRVEGVLRAILQPGEGALSWASEPSDDLSFILEARLDRIPTHIIELLPWPHAVSPRTSLRPPQIALMIVGQGARWYPNDRLLNLAAPLTFALEPYAPYALEWAEQARAASKEVIVDWGDGQGSAEAMRDRLSAIPFARGLYLPGWVTERREIYEPLLELAATNTLSVISSGRGATKGATRRGLWAGRALPLSHRGRALEAELIRLQNLAIRDGAAIGAINPRPGELGTLISWMISLERQGFEPALVSEALHRLGEP